MVLDVETSYFNKKKGQIQTLILSIRDRCQAVFNARVKILNIKEFYFIYS